MSEHTKTYLATKINSLIGDGGGHSCKSAILEGLDNSKDAFKKSNRDIPIPYIFIVWSFVRNVLAIFDNAKGAEDIRTVWGGGDISIKSTDCIGKKMTGCLAADLYFVPETVMYISFNSAYSIPLQYSKWDVKGMCEVFDRQFNMKLADEEITDLIEMQTNKKLTDLHPILLAELKDAVGNHPAICDLIDSKTPMFGKIIIGGEDNAKFGLLKKDFEKNINEILLFHYNEYIRQGIEIRVIDLDNGSTQVLNAETAQAHHILGKDSIIADQTQGIAVFESLDFGPIDLNRVHCFEVIKFEADGQLFVEYKNFDIKIRCGQQLTVLQGPELAEYEARKNNVQIQKTTCRAYVSCLSKSERDEQKAFINERADELRKMQIMINPGDGSRGLARIEYPEEWPGVSLRNCGDIAFALCFETKSIFLNLSANKSNITRSNIDSNLLNVLKDTVLKVIKLYNYNNWKSDNGESRILASRDKFVTALGLQLPAAHIHLVPAGNQDPLPNPVPLPQPPRSRARPRTKQEVLQKVNAMTAQELINVGADIDDIIKNNLDKISASKSRDILKLLLSDVDDNTILVKGSQLFN
jgi:hypothetical protein